MHQFENFSPRHLVFVTGTERILDLKIQVINAFDCYSRRPYVIIFKHMPQNPNGINDIWIWNIEIHLYGYPRLASMH